MKGPQETSPKLFLDSLNNITNSKLYILTFQHLLKSIEPIDDRKQFLDDSLTLAIQKNLTRAVMQLLPLCPEPTQTQLNQYLVEAMKVSRVNTNIIHQLLTLGANPAEQCAQNAFSIMVSDKRKWMLLPQLLKAMNKLETTAPIQMNQLLLKITKYILDDKKKTFLPEHLLLDYVKKLLMMDALANSSTKGLEKIFQSVLKRNHRGLIALFVEYDINSTCKFLSLLPSAKRVNRGNPYKNLGLILEEHERMFPRAILHFQLTAHFLFQNFSNDLQKTLLQWYMAFKKQEAALISKLSLQVANARARIIEKKYAFLCLHPNSNMLDISWIITTFLIALKKANSEEAIHHAVSTFLDTIYKDNIQDKQSYKTIKLDLIKMELIDKELLAHYQHKYQANETRQIFLKQYYAENKKPIEHSQTIYNFIRQFMNAEPQYLKKIAMNFTMLVCAQKIRSPQLAKESWNAKDALINQLIESQFIARSNLETIQFQEDVQLIYQKILLVERFINQKSLSFFPLLNMEMQFINNLRNTHDPDEIKVYVEAFVKNTSGENLSPETKVLRFELAKRGFIKETDLAQSDDEIYDDDGVTFSVMN